MTDIKYKITDSRLCFQGKILQDIRELCEIAFGETFRLVKVNRKEKRFEILLVDADDKKVKEFLEKYPQCKIESLHSIP